MKFADLFRLAFSSLWQQRGRTMLSVVGVVVGSLILVFSLAAQVGVKQAVVRVFSESNELRFVEVSPQYYTPEAKIPAEEIEPVGAMSDKKRKRIRTMLIRQWQRAHQQERKGIGRAQLDELKAVDHVVQVVPAIGTMGWAIHEEKESQVEVAGMPADDGGLQKRLVSGDIPATNDDGVVIHEFLAYLWGAQSDADVAKLVGQNLRLEIRFRAEALAHTLAFRGGGEMKLTTEEIQTLNQIFDRIPALIGSLPLPEKERAVLQKAFPPIEDRKVPEDRVIAKEFVIRGVFRAENPDERRTRFGFGRYGSEATVLVPLETATDFFYEHLDDGGLGFMQATILVDGENHLRDVSKRVSELGYNEWSLIELVEVIQKYVTNVTWICAAVAAIALFVAAVGIANTMILSVVERTHEIGVMKATGARDRHVLLLFLFEGALIGLLGAAAALIVSQIMGIGIDYAIRRIIESELNRSFGDEPVLVFTWWQLALVVGFSTCVTVLAAVAPARRAARISPVAALRHE
jgi:putative ABC transport system permease protein